MGWEKIVLPKFTEGSIDPQENSSFELFHFLKREVELAGKVEVIGLLKKNRIVFSLGGAWTSLSIFVSLCFIFQFSSIFGIS